MLSLSQKKKITNENVLRFIERLDQDTYGFGCCTTEITEYLSSKEELLIFSQLLNDAIKNLKSKYTHPDPTTMQRFDNFYDGLMKEIENYNEQ